MEKKIMLVVMHVVYLCCVCIVVHVYMHEYEREKPRM